MTRPGRRACDLTEAIARKYKATIMPFDPECIHARPLSPRDGMWRCETLGKDPVLDADCRGCPEWEGVPE